MAFRFDNKQNIGIFATLALIILLTKCDTFLLLMNTVLGKIILILLIFFATYSNKILGLVNVFLVILASSYHTVHAGYGYLEGFTDASGNEVVVDMSGNNAGSNVAAIKDTKKQLQAAVKEKLLQKQEELAAATSSAATSTTTPTTTTTESFKGGKEGFCITDKENTILRGKQSNSIPIYDSKNDMENVLPSERSVFSKEYATV